MYLPLKKKKNSKCQCVQFNIISVYLFSSIMIFSKILLIKVQVCGTSHDSTTSSCMYCLRITSHLIRHYLSQTYMILDQQNLKSQLLELQVFDRSILSSSLYQNTVVANSNFVGVLKAVKQLFVYCILFSFLGGINFIIKLSNLYHLHS